MLFLCVCTVCVCVFAFPWRKCVADGGKLCRHFCTVFVSHLLNIPATGIAYLGADLIRQLCMLPH